MSSHSHATFPSDCWVMPGSQEKARLGVENTCCAILLNFLQGPQHVTHQRSWTLGPIRFLVARLVNLRFGDHMLSQQWWGPPYRLDQCLPHQLTILLICSAPSRLGLYRIWVLLQSLPIQIESGLSVPSHFGTGKISQHTVVIQNSYSTVTRLKASYDPPWYIIVFW